MSILVVTNGHGEDQLAVCLVDGLRRRWPWLRIEGIPLVGEGRRLAAAGIAVPGPRVRVPSGGLVRPEWETVVRDLRAGLIGQFRRQMRFVASRRDAVERIIAVGDVFAGWVAGRCLPKKPLILVATAKSEYIHGHFRFETWWMKRRAQHVFARDERTAHALRQAGVAASWAGNLMMDAMEITGSLSVPAAPGRVIALLPGSRDDAYVNLESLADVLERLAVDGVVVGLVPLAPGLDVDRAVHLLQQRGWRAAEHEDKVELPSHAVPPRSGSRRRGDASQKDVALQKGRGFLWLLTGAFGDVLATADVVVGLAGTANEQAAGLGKPVVAFPGPGVQFGPRFMRAQKLLLGDALAVAPPTPEAVAAEVRDILTNPTRRERMAAAGRERMGPPGAADRMAAAIGRLWGLEDDV